MFLKTEAEKRAFLFFLFRERHRHLGDISRINRDIAALYFQGIELPDPVPDVDEFIKVEGVDYGGER